MPSPIRELESGDALSPAAGDGYPEVFEAFNEIAEAINVGLDTDSLLHMVAARICGLVGVRRCSVYLKDARTGLFRGKVAHADRNIDAAIKGLTAGIEADGFTREILETKRPVLIVNAQSDPRPVRAAMLEWNVQTMLGVPMVLKREVIGLLFLDNEDAPHEYTESEQALCAIFGNLSAIAISHAQLTAKLRVSLQTVEQRNRTLRKAAAIEDRLANLVLEGATLQEISEAVSELTGKPAAIFDRDLRPLASAVKEPDDRTVLPGLASLMRTEDTLRETLENLEGRRPRLLDWETSVQLKDRLLVTPVSVGDDVWGYLVVVEHGGWFSAREMIVARRAGTIIALELSAARRAAEAEAHATESLARDLLSQGDERLSLEHRADYYGICLNRPHVLCLFTERSDPARLTARRVREALERVNPESRTLVTRVEEGVVAVVEAPDGKGSNPAEPLKALLRDAAASIGPDGAVAVAISSVCRTPTHYPAAYREAVQVSRCMSVYGPSASQSVLAAHDLGAARLLLAGVSRDDAEKFAQDTVGVLLDKPSAHALLETLQVFFDASRSVRRAAKRLGVHENTIRYRLHKIEDAIGLRISGDADDQLTAQLALLILRLGDRLPPETTEPQDDDEPPHPSDGAQNGVDPATVDAGRARG